MQNKKLLAVAVTLLALAGPLVGPLGAGTANAAERGVVVLTAPPAERVEIVPPPRAGYVWAPGYWRWEGHRHVWARGHWERARTGYHYVPPRWDQRARDWHFNSGAWVRD